MIEAYPLAWPAGWPRTSSYQRRASNFGEKSFALVRDELIRELKRYNATDVVLSTNIPLRKDGLPYSGYRQPDDAGVAVYFNLSSGGKKKPLVFACDRWRKIEENIHAIYKTIDALRGIQRWGSSDLMERAFTGFAALPAPAAKKPWHDILGVHPSAPPEAIASRYKVMMFNAHPDMGGTAAAAAEINAAYDEAKRVKGFR